MATSKTVALSTLHVGDPFSFTEQGAINIVTEVIEQTIFYRSRDNPGGGGYTSSSTTVFVEKKGEKEKIKSSEAS